MTDTEAAYMAGLIDGEGHVGVNLNRPSSSQNIYFNPEVNITNTNRELLESVVVTTGLGEIHPKPRKDKQKHKPAYNWKPRTYEIYDFLVKVRPYLRAKKKQAQLVLEFLRILAGKKPVNRQDTIAEQADKQLIYEELRELNKRGPA